MATATVLLAEMTRERIRKLAPEATAVLPTASTEQHGPHMPVMCDTAIVTALCRQAAELAAAEIPVAVTPTLAFGYSHVHFPHPGQLSLSPATFLRVVVELGESLYKSGFRRIAIINSHGNNDDLIRVAALELADNLPVSIAATSYWTVASRALVEETDAGRLDRMPGHGGAFETSVMLALRPELVDGPPSGHGGGHRPVTPQQPRTPLIRLAGIRYGTSHGYSDVPAAGTAEAGRRYLDTVARELAAFLVSFHRQHPEDEAPQRS